jgi:NADPH:quinone reductase-like Zn-dependent oxidoreductase
MKAIVLEGYGAPATLAVREVDPPAPRADEALIRVRAAGLNAADRLLMRGDPYAIRLLAGGVRRPRPGFVLGRDVAGVVEAVGERVVGLRPGDEVFAEAQGTLAPLVRVPARYVAPKPAGVTFTQAAALPVAGTTALQGLRDRGGVRAGMRVLVNGAAGGIGTYAVQVARWLGAEVTAVARRQQAAAQLTALGASHVLSDLPTDGRPRYDVLFDLVGNHPLPALRRALTPTGTLVMSAGGGGRWLGPTRRIAVASGLSPFVGQRLRPYAATRSRAHLVALGELTAAGTIVPVIDRVYPFDDALAALAHLDHGHPVGKVVVTLDRAA